MKMPNSLTMLIIILFTIMIWQMQMQHWGTFLLIIAAEAALIAIRATEFQKSKRL